MARRPRVVWIVTAVALGALALGVTQLEANGLQAKDSSAPPPSRSTGRRCWPATSGAGNPVQVIGRAEAAGRLQSALKGTSGVTAVTDPVVGTATPTSRGR